MEALSLLARSILRISSEDLLLIIVSPANKKPWEWRLLNLPRRLY